MSRSRDQRRRLVALRASTDMSLGITLSCDARLIWLYQAKAAIEPLLSIYSLADASGVSVIVSKACK